MAYDPTEGNSFGQNALIGAGKFFNDVGLRARQLMGDKQAQALIDEHKRLDVPLMNTWGGMLGNTGAGMLATAPLAGGLGAVASRLPMLARAAAAAPNLARTAGAATQGGLSAAMDPVHTGESAAGNIGTGAAFGALGQTAANAVGALARPAIDYAKPAIAQLAAKARELNIPVRAGQITQSVLGNFGQNLMSLLPMSGRKASQDAQRKALTVAATDTMGEPSESAVKAVDMARTNLGSKFDTISGRNNMHLSQGDVQTLGGISADHVASGGTDAEAKQLQNFTDNVQSQYAQNGGVIPGTQYQAFRKQLGRNYRSAGGSDSPMGYSWSLIRDKLDDSMFRALPPDEAAAWQDTQHKWANMKTIEQALPRKGDDLVEGTLDPTKLTSVMTSPASKNSFNSNAMQGPMGSSDLSDVAKVGNAFVRDQPSAAFGHMLGWGKDLGTLGTIGAVGFGASHLLPEPEQGTGTDSWLKEHPWLTAGALGAGSALLGGTAGRFANSEAFAKGIPWLAKGLEGAEARGIPASFAKNAANAVASGVPSNPNPTAPSAANAGPDPFAGLEEVK